jgi:hypothetical protein
MSNWGNEFQVFSFQFQGAGAATGFTSQICCVKSHDYPFVSIVGTGTCLFDGNYQMCFPKLVAATTLEVALEMSTVHA